MSYLEAVLVARARAEGRAQRSAMYRHRHLTKKPMGIALWQLGAEPFTAAAVAWGFDRTRRELVVAGEPRDRELAFRALATFARSFNPWFEGNRTVDEGPQIVVQNQATLRHLTRLGRRLSYLSDRDGRRPDEDLVRLGRHLAWLGEHSRLPGQQLVVVATELLNAHWTTGLSALEVQQLPALLAAINPPTGMTGEEAAAIKERLETGPLPGEADDRQVERLLRTFDKARGRGVDGYLRTDESVVAPLLAPFRQHYDALVGRGWPLLWDAIDNERRYPEADGVERRWNADIEDLNRHLEWTVVKSGRYRTRATNRQAAFEKRDAERAQEQLVAEEIVSDPLRMVPCLLKHDALEGRVVKTDMNHKEPGAARAVRRPVIVVETEDECMMPVGKALYWTRTAASKEWVVEDNEPLPRGGSRVTLKRLSGSNPGLEPARGDEVVFSIYSTKRDGYSPPLTYEAPWTHARKAAGMESIEDGDGRPWE